MSAGVYRQALNSIQPNTQNSLVIGVIINSLNSKTFEANSSQYQGGTRAVWTFTLRDSDEDFINVTVWGTVQFIDKLVLTFHIGSVVDVINAKVTVRQPHDRNENFCPTVSSPYALTVNEGVALIQIHDDDANKSKFERLLRLPTKDSSQLLTIKRILDQMEAMQEQFVDMLVVVTFVSDSRTIVTRDGRSLVCRDIEVADGSTKDTIPLKLWEHEWVRLSGIWEPSKTVLFIADARIAFDTFKRKTGITIVRKTLITENPDLPQAAEIRKSVHCNPNHTPQDPFAVPNPESIKTVMTIHEITERLNQQKIGEGDRIQFVTILYASVTEINMDSGKPGAQITRCALCKRLVVDGNDSCMNLDCPCGNGSREPTNVTSLYLKLNLKDNSGYLIGCRLTGPAAEKALDCTVAQFKAMDNTARSELKWKLLLEKCDVRLQVLGPTTSFPRSLYNILSIRRIRGDEKENENLLDISGL